MKAITHNLLMCNKKTCNTTDKNYPLILKASNISYKDIEFDEEKTKIFFKKQDLKGLNAFTNYLGLQKYDLEKIDQSIQKQDEFWKYIHHILFETFVNEGMLICPNCKREYPINNGIINMVLNDDELK